MIRLLVALLLGGVAAASPLSAQDRDEEVEPDLDEARYRFRQGVVAYDSGHFADAVEHFEVAHRLSQRDEMYYNLFLAHRDNANLPGAISALELYLDSGASAQLAPQRERLDGVLTAMRDRVESETTRVVEVDVDVDVDVETNASGPPSTEPSGTNVRLIAAIASFGVAAGGLAFGVAMHVKRGNEAEQLDEACRFGPEQNLCQASFDQQSLADRHSRFGGLRWLGYGIALAGVAGGVTALLLGSRSEDEPDVQASCHQNGCTAFVRGTF
ncbi:MAG: hypothetical protein AB8H86_26045 [Polyangiales bacterium]